MKGDYKMTYAQQAVINKLNKNEILYKVTYKLNGKEHGPILTHEEMLKMVEVIVVSNKGWTSDKYVLISTTPITKENYMEEVA
jgi:hypothetical protein